MRFQFYTPPLVKKMIWVFVGCFVAQHLLAGLFSAPGFLSGAPRTSGFLYVFGLVPHRALLEGYVWQFGSYLFFHGNLTHLLFNILAFWMFGSELCTTWKNRFFLVFFFACGVGAGIFHVITTYIFFPNSVVPYIPTIGNSGAVYGILMAYALTFGNRMILFFFLFPMKARTAVLIIGAIELFYSIGQTSDGIAHLAHLGGMLVGFILLRWERFWYKFKMARYQRQRKKLKDKLRVIVDQSRKENDKDNNDNNHSKTYH